MRRLPYLSALALTAATACAFGDDPIHVGADDVDATTTDAAATVDAPPGPDAGVDAPPVACTLVPQAGCAGGRACDLADHGTTTCREVSSGGIDDDACAAAAQCAAGYSCLATAGQGSCLAFCRNDGDCAPASGSRCAIRLSDGAGTPIPGGVFCSQACSPRTGAGCPATWNCAPIDDAAGDLTRCVPAGTGGVGASCASVRDCRIGHLCVERGATTTCERSCRVGVAGDCTGGASCQGFTNTPTIIGGVEWGACQ